MEQLTAAHRTLPFQTWVQVTNLRNGKQVDVRITDRGPFVNGRIIDLSLAAARELDMVRAGVVPVRLRVIQPPARNKETRQDVAAADPPPAAPDAVATPALPAPVAGAESADASEVPAPVPGEQTAAGYAVQAAAFSDAGRAQAFRDSLPFPDVRVVSGGSRLWRVLVGHNLNMDAATALAAQVKESAEDAFVVPDR